MKESDRIRLDEAIRRHYAVPPLTTDIAAAAADAVYAVQEEPLVSGERWWYAFSLALCIGGIVYWGSVFGNTSGALLLLAALIGAGLLGMSAKEYATVLEFSK